MQLPFYPTRLVKVDTDTRCDHEIRLVSGSASCEYTTLSYCWGACAVPRWRTTTSNLDSRYAGFSTTTLPQTLKDAINLTRTLGYGYLWVDALCILQDCPRDWEEQSSQMGLIYNRSSVTIAASASVDVGGGIFNSESVNQAQDILSVIEIPTRMLDGQESTLYIFGPSSPSTQDEESPRELREDALSPRGWVYQERLFSPRTLHYTSKQLFWECREHYLAEDGLYTQPFTVGRSGGWTVSRRLQDVVRPSYSTFCTTWKWYTMVLPDYTRRLLSQPKDKLPAISAVAKLIHETTGVQYHAGLWLDAIQLGLCWSVTEPATRPLEYRSPSYSWPAVDGAVQWTSHLIESFPPPADFVITAHHISSRSSDPFGTVEGGYLEVFGQLKQAVAIAHATDTRDPLNYANAHLWERSEAGDSMWRIDGVYPPRVILDQPVVDILVEVQCFLLCSTQPEIPSNRYWESWMLLLQPTGTENSYSRVGIAALREWYRGGWFNDTSRETIRLI